MRISKNHILAGLCLASALLAGGLPAMAAELRLRGEAAVRTPVVTLGDLADVLSISPQETQRLTQLELFSAPPAGQQRYVRIRELQDLLLARGLNLTEHRFSGSNQVLVTTETAKPAPAPRERLTSAETKKAASLVQDALLRYLRRGANVREVWNTDFQLDDNQTRAVLKSRDINVQGGTSPFTGPQRFQITLDLPEGPATISLNTQVSRPPMVVVAVRSLSRGTVVRQGDVQLVSAEVPTETPDAVRSLDEVLGREITRTIPEGRLVEAASLRRPLLVQRGDPVTVYARSSGIHVRTMARAKEEGSLGDVIALESMHNRSNFLARVTGFQEVDVFAHAIQAEDARRGRSGR